MRGSVQYMITQYDMKFVAINKTHLICAWIQLQAYGKDTLAWFFHLSLHLNTSHQAARQGQDAPWNQHHKVPHILGTRPFRGRNRNVQFSLLRDRWHAIFKAFDALGTALEKSTWWYMELYNSSTAMLLSNFSPKCQVTFREIKRVNPGRPSSEVLSKD